MRSARILSSLVKPFLFFSTTLALSTLTLFAQTIETQKTEAANLSLPDAPGYSRSQSGSSSSDPKLNGVHPAQKVASIHRVRIDADETAPRLTYPQQVSLGLENSVSLFSITGWFFAAGWSHVTNAIPNYGTDSGAFGQRLGAAAARGASESIFSNAVLAPALHEDFRYYRMGRSSGRGFVHRGLYAVSRVFVTRTLDGKRTPNIASLAGNFGGAMLTTAYYPARDTSAGEVAKTYGGALAGGALGNIVNEFLPDALAVTRLRKR